MGTLVCHDLRQKWLHWVFPLHKLYGLFLVPRQGGNTDWGRLRTGSPGRRWKEWNLNAAHGLQSLVPIRKAHIVFRQQPITLPRMCRPLNYTHAGIFLNFPSLSDCTCHRSFQSLSRLAQVKWFERSRSSICMKITRYTSSWSQICMRSKARQSDKILSKENRSVSLSSFVLLISCYTFRI